MGMEQRRSGRQKCRKGGEKLIRISQLKLPITFHNAEAMNSGNVGAFLVYVMVMVR